MNLKSWIPVCTGMTEIKGFWAKLLWALGLFCIGHWPLILSLEPFFERIANFYE
jgi:hypothetical protein